MEDTISRAEHEEFKRRLDEQNERQDTRIKLLEKNVEKLTTLTTSVERLAVNIETMVKEQEKQGKRLENLENKDGEMWRSVVTYSTTAIIGIIIGCIAVQFGVI